MNNNKQFLITSILRGAAGYFCCLAESSPHFLPAATLRVDVCF